MTGVCTASTRRGKHRALGVSVGRRRRRSSGVPVDRHRCSNVTRHETAGSQSIVRSDPETLQCNSIPLSVSSMQQ